MQKIVDQNNIVLEGLMRTPSGAIAVNDNRALQKYLLEKELIERVTKTEEQIADIHSMLKIIMQKICT